MINLLRTFGLRGLWMWVKMRLLKSHKVKVPGYGTVHLRPSTADWDVFRQVFIDKEYEFDYHTYLKSPHAIIDLGAHIGLFSLYIQKVYPLAKLFLVEPDSSNIDYLHANCYNLNWAMINHAAVVGENMEGMTYSKGKDTWDGKLVHSTTHPQVELLKMSDLVGGSAEFLVKIDIEGMEKYIFESNTEWMQKVKIITIELHDHITPGCTESFYGAIGREWGSNYKTFKNGENLFVVNLNK